MQTCTDPTGKGYCTSFMSDPANCGACGMACPQGYSCQNATCVQGGTTADGGTSSQTCAAGTASCLDATGKPYCANLAYDNYNCGACGRLCPGGYACQNGTCMPAGGDGGTTAPPADGGAPPP
jgi:hypothetical protein